MTNKTTKKEYFAMIRNIIENSGADNAEELISFVDASIEAIDRKAEKAKEKAAEKRKSGDELLEQVENALTDELRSAEAIMKDIESDDEITKQKVIARLTKLVKAGIARKDSIKEDKRKVMGYAIATPDAESTDSVE